MLRKERRKFEDIKDQAMFAAHHERVCRWRREEREAKEFNRVWSEDRYSDDNAWDFMES